MTRLVRATRIAACLAVMGALAAPALAQAATCTPAGAMPVETAYPAKPTPPPTPSCLDLKTMKTTCTDKQLNAWKASREAYVTAFNTRVQAVQTYLNSVTAWQNAVTDYSTCESTRLQTLMTAEKAEVDEALK